MPQKPVYTSVKVIDNTHQRFGQVGNVVGGGDPVPVKFNDGVTVNIQESKLEGL